MNLRKQEYKWWYEVTGVWKKALQVSLWRTRFERGYGHVVRLRYDDDYNYDYDDDDSDNDGNDGDDVMLTYRAHTNLISHPKYIMTMKVIFTYYLSPKCLIDNNTVSIMIRLWVEFWVKSFRFPSGARLFFSSKVSRLVSQLVTHFHLLCRLRMSS
jgi:hypothetical protein